MEEPRKEIIVKMRMSRQELDDIMVKCGIAGITLGELLENYIDDLVGQGNGADESDLAGLYFERRWSCPENTLLQHLLLQGYDPNDYISFTDCIAGAESLKKDAILHPGKYDAEKISCIDNDIGCWASELLDMQAGWCPGREVNIAKEIEVIKKWLAECEELQEHMSTGEKYKVAVRALQAISQRTGRDSKTGGIDEWTEAEAFRDCRQCAENTLDYLKENTMMENKRRLE